MLPKAHMACGRGMRETTRNPRSLLIALGALIALAATACAEKAPQDALEPAGPVARQQDSLWDITFLIAVIVFVLVEGAIVFTLIRFRHKPGRQAADFHGNTKLEVVLTLVPALILATLAVPTMRTLFDLANEAKAAKMTVDVVAHRFWWEFTYRDQDLVTANELHIPTDTPVRISLRGAATDLVTGQAEVIHAFWVPRLAGKQDIVPGHVNNIVIEADEPGVYKGQCTEFCGLGHGYMRLQVIAHEPNDFATWLADQQRPAASVASEGERLFVEGADNISQPCATCHTIQGTDAAGASAPDLTHFASRRTFAGAIFETNEANLRAWLADPAAVKPGATMPDVGLTSEQIDQLVEFLLSLE